MLTENILKATSEPIKSEIQIVAVKFLQVFQNPSEHMSYLQSAKFATDLINVCMDLETVLEAEPRCKFLQSPVMLF